VAMGHGPGRSRGTPTGLAAAASRAGPCGVALRGSLMAKDSVDRALRRAQRATWLDEDPRDAIMHLRSVDLRIRPGLRRDIVIRCFEQTRRSERMNRIMRREAARWMKAARDELARNAKR